MALYSKFTVSYVQYRAMKERFQRLETLYLKAERNGGSFGRKAAKKRSLTFVNAMAMFGSSLGTSDASGVAKDLLVALGTDAPGAANQAGVAKYKIVDTSADGVPTVVSSHRVFPRHEGQAASGGESSTEDAPKICEKQPRGYAMASNLPILCAVGTLAAATPPAYPKTILSSGQLDVTVYLPGNLGYYNSTRFEWGSMIGEITLGEAEFFSDLWRTATDPNWGKDHDPSNPEGVLGLASEFGCGSDGPDCPAGWGRETEASNGVLGYHEAGMGDPFLKIGVGKLKKGSCDACNSDTQYHFNSRYDFAEPPVWTVSHPSGDAIDMIHEASLEDWGYRLHRHLQVHGDMLVMRSELTNTGSKAFKTVQYTHNFLAFNRQQIGPPLKLQFGQDLSSYSEPGNEQGWSVPIASRFVLTAPNVWTANSALPAGSGTLLGGFGKLLGGSGKLLGV
eukprot:s2976_g9.t1